MWRGQIMQEIEYVDVFFLILSKKNQFLLVIK